nr:retrovirus-related Pol polyprotein from transposon TNT 1-94 [Tanacetum cinerariifolium]
MKVEESLNVTFDESPPPTKLSPLVDDDVGEEEAIRKNTKIVNINNEEDESIQVDKIVNIKESKNHPLDQVIGNLNQITLRSQAQNHSNFFCFISTIKPKIIGTGIETVVDADSDHISDYVDRISINGVYTFMGCCLTSWFAKKQTALAISTTEAEYVSAGKACQQALWLKQALIDYDIRLDAVPIMCDNKGAIDFSKNPVQHSITKHIEIRHHFLRDNV